jgi:hypothetical protein
MALPTSLSRGRSTNPEARAPPPPSMSKRPTTEARTSPPRPLREADFVLGASVVAAALGRASISISSSIAAAEW